MGPMVCQWIEGLGYRAYSWRLCRTRQRHIPPRSAVFISAISSRQARLRVSLCPPFVGFRETARQGQALHLQPRRIRVMPEQGLCRSRRKCRNAIRFAGYPRSPSPSPTGRGPLAQRGAGASVRLDAAGLWRAYPLSGSLKANQY